MAAETNHPGGGLSRLVRGVAQRQSGQGRQTDGSEGQGVEVIHDEEVYGLYGSTPLRLTPEQQRGTDRDGNSGPQEPVLDPAILGLKMLNHEAHSQIGDSINDSTNGEHRTDESNRDIEIVRIETADISAD